MGLPYITPRACDLFTRSRTIRSVWDLSQAALSYRVVGAWSSEGIRANATPPGWNSLRAVRHGAGAARSERLGYLVQPARAVDVIVAGVRQMHGKELARNDAGQR